MLGDSDKLTILIIDSNSIKWSLYIEADLDESGKKKKY